MTIIKTLFISSSLLTLQLYAGWQDQLGGLINQVQKTQTQPSKHKSDSSVNLSNADMNSALKTALSKGVSYAVNDLGKEGGYLNNPLVKISLPKNLQTSAKMIRKLGGGKYVDDLIIAINKAAQEAAPKSANIFMQSIKDMTVSDAKGILTGDDDAATQYFRKNTTTKLSKVIEPIVKNSMAHNDVSKYYSTFMSFYKKNAGILQNKSLTSLSSKFGLDAYLPNQKDENLDSYVTHKSIDGLMTMIAQKEKEIRKNPMLQHSDILKKVFGAF